MSLRDDLDLVFVEEQSSGFLAFIAGAVIGAGIALLLAPRSGAETQREIAEGVRRLRDRAEDSMAGARDRALHAVEEGRRAAREARQELEERLSAAKSETGAPSVRPRGLDDFELTLSDPEIEPELPGSELG
jgi:gas vesicle protein